jgi:hypothetical protein
MRRTVFVSIVVLAASTSGLVAQESRPTYVSPTAEKLDVRVLYAGKPSSERARDFVAFLEATFAKVETVDLDAIDVAASKDFDVVIVDGPSPYRDDGDVKLPKRRAPEGWTKPTILIGAAGGAFVRELKLKIDWW